MYGNLSERIKLNKMKLKWSLHIWRSCNKISLPISITKWDRNKPNIEYRIGFFIWGICIYNFI